jgi:hypothetical protein
MNEPELRPRRTAFLGIVVAILTGVVLLEIGFRTVETRLSGNLAHIATLPEVLAVLDRGGEEPAGLDVVVLGNSLMKNGIAADVLEAGLTSQGSDTALVLKVTPDATYSWDWWCLARSQVIARPAAAPDELIIGFAWGLLSDQRLPTPSRLGAYFCAWDDLGPLMGLGMTDPGEVTEFALGRVSRLYANRQDVGSGVLSRVIPAYREVAGRINVTAPPDLGEGDGVEQEYSFRVLRSLLSTAVQQGVGVTLVAMPTTRRYALPAGLEEVARSGGARFIDMRAVPGLTPELYLDSIHLGPEGAALFTRQLASELRRSWQTRQTVD